MAFNSIPEIIEDIRAGRMVVVVDDEDRENEGDLIMAAGKVTPEHINFMARYARGLICLPLSRDRCDQLDLSLMVSRNRAQFETNFTVSIEASTGVTTGISAADRARTIQVASAKNAQPADVVQPGHVFPLMAEPGGVLTRAGHTEAAVDLAKLAGMESAGVLVEILNEDGSMARRPELEKFAQEHGLKIGSIADLIQYRMQTEMTVERIADQTVDTEWGPRRLVAYRDIITGQVHLAQVHGQPKDAEVTCVRVHLRNALSDLMQVHGKHLGMPLRAAQQYMADESTSVLIVLGQEETAQHVTDQLSLDGQARDTAAGGEHSETLRTYGIGAQILADLGVSQMKVLSAPKKFHGLSGFGLEVVEYVEPE